MQLHEKFMHRCLELAEQGFGSVAPNPMVGAVLVHDGRIVSEGFHRKYGFEHAEVMALTDVTGDVLKSATLYVSLEPCSHTGKTPPCADLILKKGIKHVVVGALDPNPQVAGKGIKKLMDAGVQVEVGICETKCIALNQRFYHFHQKKQPYLILKWAESSDGFMDKQRVAGEIGSYNITQPETQLLNHKWRSEEQGILVGANTFNTDLPQLTNRKWPGNPPCRMVLCSKVANLNFSHLENWGNSGDGTVFYKEGNPKPLKNIVFIPYQHGFQDAFNAYCYEQKIQSVIIEGGSKVLLSFIEQNTWNEARRLIGVHALSNGLAAPKIDTSLSAKKEELPNGDLFELFKNNI